MGICGTGVGAALARVGGGVGGGVGAAHAERSKEESWPGKQTEQADEPAAAWNLPRGQLVHVTSAPFTGWNFPTGQ